MSYWGKSSNPASKSTGKRPVPQSQEKSGGLPTKPTVIQIVKSLLPNPKENEFYELEMAEVLAVILDEDELPEKEDGR